MSFEVKACSSLEEMRAALAPMMQYFGASASQDFVERMGRILPPDRTVSARVDDAVVAGAAAYPFDVTVPGGRVPAAGLTFVAVLPTHRRRGLLRAMMRAHIDACRRRGEPIAYLWASEDTIYRRFGFGLAGLMGAIDIARDRARLDADFPAADIRIVPLTQAESLVTPVYDAVSAATPGMFSRSSDWWQSRLLIDPDWRRRNGGELQCAVLMAGDRPAAYAFYRLNMMFERGVNTGNVSVLEAMGRTPESLLAIWRYLLSIDWFSRINAPFLPLDHPLLLGLTEPRRLGFMVRDGVWVRLVDVGVALSARSYATGEPIAIEITDEFCPWNAGRWLIGTGGAKRTEAAADLACGVDTLGSAYLGGFSWHRLAAVLRVKELRPGAIERADALFRSTPAPWCCEVF